MFYVTAGRGTEDFALEEIKGKLSAAVIPQNDEKGQGKRDGKVFFQIEDLNASSFKDMLKLKSVERIFVAIANYKNGDFVKGKRSFLDKLMEEISNTKNYIFAQRVIQQLISLQPFLINSQECLQLSKRRKDMEPDAVKKKYSNYKKVKLSSEIEEHVHSNEIVTISSEKVENFEQYSLKSKEFKDNLSPIISCMNNKNEGTHSQTQIGPFVTKRKSSVCAGYFCNTEANQDKDCSNPEISFRMSVKCSGKTRKWLNIKKLSKDLSWRVVKITGWKIELHNAIFEICVHISDDYVTIGVPLTRLPLSCRNYILDPGLRSPIAWIMTKLAGIEAGFVVLDPMCGKGTLLIEACSEIQNAIYIGTDNSTSQLNVAENNTSHSGFRDMIHFIQADALALPLKDNSVNVVVCDAPFNKKYFTSRPADTFYTAFLIEMSRVLHANGKLVLLLSEEFSTMIVNLLTSMSNTNGKNPADLEISSNHHHHHPHVSNNQPTETEYEEVQPIISCVKIPFTLLTKSNVKLGETLASILVFEHLKSRNKSCD